MNYDLLLPLIGFAFVSSATPGPNNLMLLASGANFGLWRTVPHMFGIGLGFGLMIVLVGMGLMQVFDAFPVTDLILKVVSVIYLIWLAWKIATAAPALSEDAQPATATPMTFLQAAAFQWVNPKAWSMGVYAITNFAKDDNGARGLFAVCVVAFAFVLVNFPSVTIWTVLGQQMRKFLTSPARLRVFNWSMAVLLLLTLIPVIFPTVFA